MEPVSRRGLMTVLAGAGLVVATSGRAFAFSEDIPSVKTLALHENACGATASHKEFVAEVERVLGDKYTAEEKRQVIATLTCPICGCPLGGLF